MQLIEIIQLVLIGFILISLVIFIFSYFGYRRRNRITSDVKQKSKGTIQKTELEPLLKSLPAQNSNTINTTNEFKKKTGVLKKNKNKFEVFKPANEVDTNHKLTSPESNPAKNK